MKNLYLELKNRQEKQTSEFLNKYVFFAFNQEQFKKGMQTLGLKETDTDKIYSLHGTGGYYRKQDAEKVRTFFEGLHKELAEAIAADKTGDGFIYDMFYYELGNHEFIITYETEDTLNAVMLTKKEVADSAPLSHGLEKAIKDIIAWDREN